MDRYFKRASDLFDRIKAMSTQPTFFLFVNQYDKHPEVYASRQIADLGIHIVFDATAVKESMRRVVRVERAEHPENAALAEEYLAKLAELENDIEYFNQNPQ